MLDLVMRDDRFNFGVHNATLMLKERWEPPTRDIAVLVDGRGEHRPAMFPIPDGIIGSAPEERDAKWRAANNHPTLACSLTSVCDVIALTCATVSGPNFRSTISRYRGLLK